MRPLTQSLLNLPPLAARSIRALAILIDAMLVAVPAVVLAFGLTAGGVGAIGVWGHADQGHFFQRIAGGGLGVVGVILCVIALVAFAVLTLYQFFLLAAQGQTIGKRICGIRVVDSLTGKPAGLVQAVILRLIVPWALTSLLTFLLGWLFPPIGALLTMLDLVPIFGVDRRCAHDYIAGTQVRWVEAKSEKKMQLVLVGVGVVAVGVTAVSAISMTPTWRASSMYWQLPQPKAEPAVVDSTPLPPPPVAPAPTFTPTPESIAPPPPLPPAPSAPVAVVPIAAPVAAEPSGAVYSWVDAQGTTSFTDDLTKIPEKYRASAKRQ